MVEPRVCAGVREHNGRENKINSPESPNINFIFTGVLFFFPFFPTTLFVRLFNALHTYLRKKQICVRFGPHISRPSKTSLDYE